MIENIKSSVTRSTRSQRTVSFTRCKRDLVKYFNPRHYAHMNQRVWHLAGSAI